MRLHALANLYHVCLHRIHRLVIVRKDLRICCMWHFSHCSVNEDKVFGLDQGVYPQFCDTREFPLYVGGGVFGRPFSLYHRSGFQFSTALRQRELQTFLRSQALRE